MLKKLKTKTGMLITLGVVFTLVLGLSYATFIFTTGKYKASELLIGKLNYGISIKEDGSTSTINSNVVTIPKNTKSYFVITITSVNPVDSNYTLAYKSNNTLEVKYTDRTSWKSNGFIKGYDDNTYSKKVRVLIDNTTNSADTTVDFAVYGGYSFNTIASISLGNGYISVTGPVTETNTLPTNRLVDIIEEDTDCITSTSNICLIGGENERNYVQYPETSNKSENIWRITGSYNIDNEVVTKLISTKTSTSTTSTLTTDLNSFYNNLTDKDIYVYNTNKFKCNSSTCAESTYTNIGLLTEYEYNQIGGLNSYLSSINPFFIQGTSKVLEATSSGIKTSTSSNLRPVIYINSDVQVTGSGTASDPYILNPSSDINLLSYTLDGKSTTLTYNNLLSKYLVNKVTCKNGTTASWNYEEEAMILTNIKTPDYCTIDFKEGYTVSLSAGSTGTVSPASQTTGYNGTVSFTVTPDVDYKLELTTNTCGGTLSGSTYTVSNITSNKSCSITFKSSINEITYSSGTLGYKLLEDNPTRTTRSSFNSIFTTTNTGTLYTATEDNTQSEKTKVYYFAGNATNNWVKFGGFYWRIIRTNHDGSVRLLYSGTATDTTSGYIGTSAFNNSDADPMYAGYMYGTNGSLASNRTNENNSTIKGVIDTWYSNNLSSYTKYISTEAVYCNDREVGSGTYNTGSTTFYYAAYSRLNPSAMTPTYNCTNSKDAFSGSNSEAKLTSPIGLMTADEVAYAGGVFGTSLTSPYAWYYLNSAGGSITKDAFWWLLSPYRWDGRAGYAGSWTVGGSYYPGHLGINGVLNSGGVRPVISIKADALWSSGDGSPENPYKIIYN